jgi:capsid protein
MASIAIALKSVDIPYSFFDESFTNYAGNRQAWLLYDQGAEAKRTDNRELLNQLTAWRIGLWILDGELTIPRSVGSTIEDIQWEWLARGIPWIDPLKEIKADVKAVGAKLTSRQRITKRNGDDWFEIMDELDAEEERIRQNREPMAGEPEPESEDKDQEDQETQDEP